MPSEITVLRHTHKECRYDKHDESESVSVYRHTKRFQRSKGQNMNKKVKGPPMAKFSFALLPEEKFKVERYAHSLKLSPSELARTAVREFLIKLEKPDEVITQEEAELAYRLRRLEERLASLLVKLTRASAQGLFFSTLPYIHGGLPKEPLPEKAMTHLWGKSREFAVSWLKKAQPSEKAISEDAVAGDAMKTDEH